MWIDGETIQAFYHTPLGYVAQKYITQAMTTLWPCVRGDVVVGFGFAGPYLDLFRGEADRVILMMPGPQGGLPWPKGKPNATVLVEEMHWPFPDNSVDRLVLAHSLEFSDHAHEVLTEAWRILKPEGQIMVIAPNRRGAWSRLPHTPFGYGTPYTGHQLFHLLEQAGFVPQKPKYCLYVPPTSRRFAKQYAPACERLGPHLFKKFGGIVIGLGQKQVHALPPKALATWSTRLMKPVPVS